VSAPDDSVVETLGTALGDAVAEAVAEAVAGAGVPGALGALMDTAAVETAGASAEAFHWNQSLTPTPTHASSATQGRIERYRRGDRTNGTMGSPSGAGGAFGVDDFGGMASSAGGGAARSTRRGSAASGSPLLGSRPAS
jgi:hypothetical protein